MEVEAAVMVIGIASSRQVFRIRLALSGRSEGAGEGQIVPGHIEQSGKLGDGDASDGACCANVVRLPQHPDEVPGQGQADDELEQRLDDLRHR